MDNIIIRVVNLPICVKGVTIPHSDGTYNIYINANYSNEHQKQILKHELTHINNSDFNNYDSIEIVEKRAEN